MSAYDCFRSLKESSVQSLMEQVSALKPGHTSRVAEIIRSFCEMNSSQELSVSLMLLNTYKDIGEAFFAEMINRPYSFSRDERRLIRRHSILSAHILEEKGFQDIMGMDLFEEILCHHERWDGKGFLRREGREIPKLSRLLAPMDFYVAMTSDRPHRKAKGHEEVVADMRRFSGTIFDPHIINKVIKSIESPVPLNGCANAM